MSVARVQLFLSTVSAEFLSYRERLRHLLTRPNVEVKVQEDFIATGDETLEMLDRYIQGCDGVIHLVGDMTGAMAKPQSVAAIASRYPELGSRFPLMGFLQPDGPSLSYTQWEAWLALWHGKKLYIATPTDGAPRDEKFRGEPEQQALQQAHLARLRGIGRYPGCKFASQEELVAEVSVSFVLDLLVKAGLNPNPYTPHNLPDRTTSSERFVGRDAELQRLAELLTPEGSRVYLTGMGGVGKSELALQHAYDNLDRYRGGIVRLDARQGLAAMASQLVTFFRGTFPQVALPDDMSSIELLPLCWNQWPAGASPQEPVLLILDDQRGENLPDEQGDTLGYAAERQLFAGLPPRFRRLISQREPAPTGAKAINLPLLERDDSLKLLALQAGESGPARLLAEPEAANAICEEVGDLPLALVLLGARLSQRAEMHLSQLLADLRAKGAEAKALQEAHPELGAQRGVVEALLISWEPLPEAAKNLGILLGVMAPAAIPWELVEACRLPDQALEEGSAFGEQQVALRRAQLLEPVGEGVYRLHPLVRHFIQLPSQSEEVKVAFWKEVLTKAILTKCQEMGKTLNLETVSYFANCDSKPCFSDGTIEQMARLSGGDLPASIIANIHYTIASNFTFLTLEELNTLAKMYFSLRLASRTLRAMIQARRGSHPSPDVKVEESEALTPKFQLRPSPDLFGQIDGVNNLDMVESEVISSLTREPKQAFGESHPVVYMFILNYLQLLPADSPNRISNAREALSSLIGCFGKDVFNASVTKSGEHSFLRSAGWSSHEISLLLRD